MRTLSLLITLLAMCLAPAATAAIQEPSNISAVPGTITAYGSATAANDAITSTTFRPGQQATVSWPDNSVTFNGTQKTKSFGSVIFAWTFTWNHYSLGVHIWTWAHYTEWSGNGQCITNKISNTGWSNYASPGWTYEGDGSYVVWTVNPVCSPLGTLWAGKQGNYYNWVFHQNDYPWQLAEAYATGNYRTYSYGCTGSC